MSKYPLVSVDECATAADIYQCGQKKDPNLVNALILDTAGPGTVSIILKILAQNYSWIFIN
jgi:hypothetical protein